MRALTYTFRPNITLKGVIAGFAILGLSQLAMAMNVQPFSSQALASAQQAGKPVAIHFHASWCPTCKLQESAFNSMKGDKSLEAMTLLVANFDTEKELRRSLGIRGQSTVVVFKGTQEKARVAGETDAGKLAAALKAGI